MALKYEKALKCILGEMQSEITLRCHSSLIKLVKIKKDDNTFCWQGSGETGPLLIAGGSANWHLTLEGSLAALNTITHVFTLWPRFHF